MLSTNGRQEFADPNFMVVTDKESEMILNQLLYRLNDIDPEIETSVRNNLNTYFPDYENLFEGLNLSKKKWEEIIGIVRILRQKNF